MKKIFIGLLISGMFGTVHVQAASNITSKVIYTGVNNSGVVFVELENTINEAGCEKTQLVIPSDSDYKDKILSIALAAKATNSIVAVKTNGCHSGSPAILKTGDGGYFYIK